MIWTTGPRGYLNHCALHLNARNVLSIIPFEVLGNPINTAADYDAVRRMGRLHNTDAASLSWLEKLTDTIATAERCGVRIPFQMRPLKFLIPYLTWR